MNRPDRFTWATILSVMVFATAFCSRGPKPGSPETEAPVFDPPSAIEEPGEEEAGGWTAETEVPAETLPPPGSSSGDAKGVLKTIYFDFDRYNLKPRAIETLNNNLSWLKNNPDFEIRIEGHCDERGTDEYNLALGDRRAITAREFLVKRGISANRIRIISFGEERPVDSRHSNSAWSKNRRAEFLIVSKLSR